MAGFDDLLAPSRAALEDNPFSEENDPFGSRRSGSPDPWASPFGGGHDTWGEDNSVAQSPTVDHREPETPVTSTSASSTETTIAEIPNPSVDAGDPLDSAAANAASSDEEDNKPLAFKRAMTSPGFRESFDVTPEKKIDNEGVTKNERAVEELNKDLSKLTVEKEKEESNDSLENERPFSETATIRPSTIEEPERSPQTPPTMFSSTSSLSGPSSSTAAAWGPLTTPTSGGWGVHEPYSQSDLDSRMSASAPVVLQTEEDDSDDDKPIGQLSFSHSTSHVSNHRLFLKLFLIQIHSQKPNQSGARSLSSRPDESSLPPLFTITVDDPQKVGDPIRSYVMYTVHTRTTSPVFQKSAFSVLRRYSDFLWLYNTLSYNNPGVVVPPVPEKNPLLFTNPILGSAGKKGYVGRFDEGFIRQRRQACKSSSLIYTYPFVGLHLRNAYKKLPTILYCARIQT